MGCHYREDHNLTDEARNVQPSFLPEASSMTVLLEAYITAVCAVHEECWAYQPVGQDAFHHSCAKI